MKISINAQAELELTESALYYARKAGAAVAHSFLSEFDRTARLLAEYPKLGAA